MAVFVVIPTVGPDAAIVNAISTKLPGKFHQLPKGEFFVSYVGTSKELSDFLGITPGTDGGAAVVASISGYYGRAPNDLWEWIAQNWA